ncbi:hypothetical protein Talka_01682 [Tepidimonas alkaliphilus]|uniref:Integral membrane protein n=1 Tax=Tepidimonas alkaliphilus TaxID=2588942 RepID=A0A554W6Q7_9BURK|nr:DUF2244 domain-containing protein [Tepidimonas alkaliphilus]TSE19258.1 hypothetical protein Talka_01682 [Tepidimonas alkaliphilus]
MPQLGQLRAQGWFWQLRRNGALTPRQLLAAWAFAVVAVLGVAAFWIGRGAVLVWPFAAVELAAVMLAFGWMARHASDREELELNESALRVRCWDAGRVRAVELPRPWVRVEAPAATGQLVWLRAGSQAVAVGRHIQPALRQQLARELRWALAQSEGARPDAA